MDEPELHYYIDGLNNALRYMDPKKRKTDMERRKMLCDYYRVKFKKYFVTKIGGESSW